MSKLYAGAIFSGLAAGLLLVCGCTVQPSPTSEAQPAAVIPESPVTSATSPPVTPPPDAGPKVSAAAPTGAPPAVPEKPAPGEKPPPVDQASAVDKRTKADPPGAKPEPLFQNWPAPQFALFVTGMQYGYIEPCGCTGLVNQKGGLSRRYACWKQLKDRGWDVVPLDAGNQVRRIGRQSEIKFQMTLEGLKQMRYRAIGFGPDDLRLSVGELVALTASDGSQTSPFVCANTALIEASLTPRYQLIKTAGGQRIGVTAVLSDKDQAKVTSGEIEKRPAVVALREVWPKLQEARCDLHVLLVYATADEARQLARQFPDFDVVVVAGDAGEPTYEAEPIANTRAVLVPLGQKAMYVCVIGVYGQGQPRLRYQRVPLDARFADSREMLDLLASYQQQLQSAGLDGLGLKPLPHPTGRQFVGAKACQECHEEDYAVWKKTPHAKAFETLVHPGERSEIARHFDPECLSCHVVGWNPQKHFPYQSGYLSREQSPLLTNVGCEECHGPGSAHVAAENGEPDNLSDEQVQARQVEMRLKLADAERKCMECHDLDNSLNFHAEGAFEKYWKKIAHGPNAGPAK